MGHGVRTPRSCLRFHGRSTSWGGGIAHLPIRRNQGGANNLLALRMHNSLCVLIIGIATAKTGANNLLALGMHNSLCVLIIGIATAKMGSNTAVALGMHNSLCVLIIRFPHRSPTGTWSDGLLIQLRR